MSDPPRNGHAKGASSPATSTAADARPATVHRRPSSKSQGKLLRRKVREMGLREGHYCTLRVLHDFANEHGEAWPTVGQLTGERLAGVSTVHERLRELERVGLVWKIKAPERPKRGPLPALEALASTDKDTGKPVVIPNDGRSLYLVVDVASRAALTRWAVDVRSSGHPQNQPVANSPAPAPAASATSAASSASSKSSAPISAESARALFEALVRASGAHATLRAAQSLEDECGSMLVKLGVTMEECAEMGAALARPVPGLMRKSKPVTHATLADLATWQEKGRTEHTWRGLLALVQHVRSERQRRAAEQEAKRAAALRAAQEKAAAAARDERIRVAQQKRREMYPDLPWESDPAKAEKEARRRDYPEMFAFKAPLVPPPPDLDAKTSAPMNTPLRAAPTASSPPSTPTKTGNG